MPFYSDNAVVLPPNDKLANTRDAIRKRVGELLGLPGLAITWQPSNIEVARSGDLAHFYGTYEYSFNESVDKRTRDFGKILEIWKQQADGSWGCVVDTWNSDLPAVPLTAAK